MQSLIKVIVLLCLSVTAVAQSNRVVGYVPNWAFSTTWDYAKLTHINISFANPDGNGNLDDGLSDNQVRELVNNAHAYGVEVLISLGGANAYGPWEDLQQPWNVDAFADNIVAYANNLGLDGVDVDLEGDDIGTHYTSFINALAIRLHGQNMLLTAALARWTGDRVSAEALSHFDFVNAMSYDATGPWTPGSPGQHSSMQMAENDLSYWRDQRGLGRDRVVVGVPFYGYDFNQGGLYVSYRDIVNGTAGAENQDQVGQIWYNGQPTIEAKTRLGMESAGGVMIWELSMDAYDHRSLLGTIDVTRQEYGGGTSWAPLNLATNKTVTTSSVEAGSTMEGANAVDRQLDTRWASDASDDQWIAVDLDWTYGIDSVKILWEDAYASHYVIEGSFDGLNWESLYEQTNNQSLENVIILSGNDEVQYLRVRGIQRATQFGYSMYELEVYGRAITMPYEGVAHQIPGRIEAEEYDEGGAGVAYTDQSAGNQFGNFRQDDVDLELCEDDNGGYSVGAFDQGEWLLYTVDVTSTDTYTFEFRVATQMEGAQMGLFVDGQSLGSIDIPNTGGWQTWANLELSGITLDEGEHVFQIQSVSSYFNMNYIDVGNGLVSSTNGNGEESIVSVYPQPAHNGSLWFTHPMSNVLIYDSQSRLVYAEKNTTKHIDTSGFPSGLYYIYSNFEENVVVNKVLITSK